MPKEQSLTPERRDVSSFPMGRRITRVGDYQRITLEIRRDLLAKIDVSGKSRREYIEAMLDNEFSALS